MPGALSPDHLDAPVLPHARRDFARVLLGHTVQEALAHVQQNPPAGKIVYFYVVDDEGRLKGVVPTRGLLLNPADTRVADIMIRQVVTLPADATVLDACELFILHRLLALPVVDRQGRMLGAVDVGLYTNEITDLADREASDDAFQLIGVRLAQVRRAPLPTVFRRRFPWLLCNIAGGLLCALLAGLFQDVLERVIVLALFIPVALALAESVAIQSLTLALQAEPAGRDAWKAVGRALRREVPLGALLGLASGGLVAAFAWFWAGSVGVAACLLASIGLSVGTAAVLGHAIPTLVARARRAARLASGPIALALSDVATLFYFLGLAAWWLP